MNLTSDDEHNWELLRERSLQPGGFGEDRVRIWPALLGAQPLSDPPPYSEVDSPSIYGSSVEDGVNDSVVDPHSDERQIKLDTDRSFVLYPGESGATPARDTLQNDLHGLLVSLFRKRRSLRYFQGFHDIMTVLFLTLPRPLHLVCAEKMALHRVRDAMGVGLEPVLGLLRVLRNLLRVADPAYAKLLESTSPLPYHALSHLLTLFSHDVPTLPLIQHVWDFLLSREPIAVVWLVAAFILHRRPSVYLLAERDEEGMIHSLLGRMPQLVDNETEIYHTENDDFNRGGVIGTGSFAEHEVACERSSVGPADSGGLAEPDVSDDSFTGEEYELDETALTSDVVQRNSNLPTNPPSPGTQAILHSETADQEHVDGPTFSTLDLALSIPLPASRPDSPLLSPEPPSPVQSSTSLAQNACVGPRDYSPSTSEHVPPRSPSTSDLTCPSASQTPTTVDEPTSHSHKSVPSKPKIKPAPLPLTYLLRQADDLLTTYPPSHPSLHVAEIMGPDSAVWTWRPIPISSKGPASVSEKQSCDARDDYLEALVNSPHIVIPSPPPSPRLGPRLSGKITKVSPKTQSRALWDARRIGRRLGALTPAERRVLFMGALLVVGAAVALKSSRSPCVEGIVKASGGDALKRLWNGKWKLMSSAVAAWGRGLP
ncbi:rab-GTPase-TBC domain-containing protein [Chiua virens]|nr:rab-GTPase-TBC domain-containing protein [Chiua virens]